MVGVLQMYHTANYNLTFGGHGLQVLYGSFEIALRYGLHKLEEPYLLCRA